MEGIKSVKEDKTVRNQLSQECLSLDLRNGAKNHCQLKVSFIERKIGSVSYPIQLQVLVSIRLIDTVILQFLHCIVLPESEFTQCLSVAPLESQDQ